MAQEPLKPLPQDSFNKKFRIRAFQAGRPETEDEFRFQLNAAMEKKEVMIALQSEEENSRTAYGPEPADGSKWVSIGPRNINGRIRTIAVDPINEDVLYAGAASGGVWKSIDGGESWRSIFDNEGSLAIGSIAIAPSNPNRIYVGTGEGVGTPIAIGLHNYPGDWVYASADGGNTWSKTNLPPGPFIARITKVLVSPFDDLEVHVWGNRGYAKSTDGGLSWISQLAPSEISDACMDPNNPNELYCYDYTNLELKKSSNGGLTWASVNSFPANSFTNPAEFVRLDAEYDINTGNTIIAARQGGTDATRTGYIRISDNGGTSWTSFAVSSSTNEGWDSFVKIVPDNTSIVFTGGRTNFIERLDFGANPVGVSIVGNNTFYFDNHNLVFSKTNSDRVYLCSDGGVYRSDDKGLSWRHVSHGLVVSQFYDVGIWPSLSNLLGGGTQDQGTIWSTSGLSWRRLISNVDGGFLEIHDLDPLIGYGEWQATRIKKTQNGWNSNGGMELGLPGFISGIPASQIRPWVGVIKLDRNFSSPAQRQIYTGVKKVYHILEPSNPPPTQWTPVSQDFGEFVSAIEIAPSNNAIIFAGTGNSGSLLGNGRIFRTISAPQLNQVWDDITGSVLPSTRPIRDISIQNSNPNRVIVVYGGQQSGTSFHVFESSNALAPNPTWQNISGNLPDISVNAVVIDPDNPGIVFIGTDVGVFMKEASSNNWLAFDNGIPNVVISDLEIDPGDSTNGYHKFLYASTIGRGMYKVIITDGYSQRDVELYLKTNILDSRERFPSPSNIQNPNDPNDIVRFWESPDIKVQQSPFFQPVGSVFDGVEFDEDLIHEDPIRGMINRFYVQIHNRGCEDATNVEVALFHANATPWLPNLQSTLVSPGFVLNPPGNPWTQIGISNVPLLEPNRPEISYWDYLVPATTATHTCLLAVVSCADDFMNNPELRIDKLVSLDRKTAIRNIHVINLKQKSFTLAVIDLHNPYDQTKLANLTVSPEDFEGGSISFFLEEITVSDPSTAFSEVYIRDIGLDEDIGVWYQNPGHDDGINRDTLWNTVDREKAYCFPDNTSAQITGIEIAPNQTMKVVISICPGKKLSYTNPQRFKVIQSIDGIEGGGCTYEVRLQQ